MNTRPPETLPYRDLARQRARISRQIGLDQLPRLASLVTADPERALDVSLAFSRDREGQVHVSGEVGGTIGLLCNRCAEALDYTLALNFDCLIMSADEIAGARGDSLSRDHDVVVVDGLQTTAAEIVEDEILLGLPERLCITDPCELAPVRDYPADAVDVAAAATRAAAEQSAEQDNPFSILAGLAVTTDKKSD